MIVYKINVMAELEKVGITYTNVKKTGVFSQSVMNKLKNGDTNITMTVLNKLCFYLEMQPRDILKFIETDEDRKKSPKLEKNY